MFISKKKSSMSDVWFALRCTDVCLVVNEYFHNKCPPEFPLPSCITTGLEFFFLVFVFVSLKCNPLSNPTSLPLLNKLFHLTA